MARPQRKHIFDRALHAMRAARRPFTPASIASAAGVSIAVARRLIAGLRESSDVIEVAAQRGAYTLTAKARKGRVEDPFGRTACASLKREHIWNALRRLGVTSARELAYAASTDEVRISEATTLRYLNTLRRAGAVFREGEGKRPAWRIKPSANTGPKPPTMRAGVYHDPNRRPA